MVSFLLQLGDSILFRSTNGCATRFAKSLSRLRFVSENSAKFPGWGCAITVKSFKVELNDLDSEESYRDTKGETHRDRIASDKRKLICEWGPLTQEEISAILNAIEPVFFTVKYYKDLGNMVRFLKKDK